MAEIGAGQEVARWFLVVGGELRPSRPYTSDAPKSEFKAHRGIVSEGEILGSLGGGSGATRRDRGIVQAIL